MKHQLMHACEGALGGAAGTFVIQRELKLAGKLPQRWQRPAMAGDPAEYMTGKVERVVGNLPPRAHRAFSKGLSWAYGMFFPAVLGLFAQRAHARRRGLLGAFLGGLGLGTAVWAIGYAAWLPATKITQPIYRQKARPLLSSLLIHLGYGVTSTLTAFGVDRALCAADLAPR